VAGIDYTADDIQVLEGLDGVRLRPGMYVGPLTDGFGLHNVVFEVAGGLIDASAEGARRLCVTLHRDAVSITGAPARGVPRDPRALTVLGGLPFAISNALCEQLRCEVVRGGARTVTTCRAGELVDSNTVATADPDGVRFELVVDRRIFASVAFSAASIADWLHARAHLTPGLTTELVDARVDPPRHVVARGDLADWVAQLAGDRPRRHPAPILVERRAGDESVALAMQWVDDTELELHSFVNAHATPAGGHHVATFLRALDRPTAGLVAVVHVHHEKARFDSYSRERLAGAPELYAPVLTSALGDALSAFAPSMRPAAPHRPPLEAALAAVPDDAATALVYADALGAAGDPRGELIAIEHALRGPADAATRDALEARAAELLDHDRAAIWDRPGGFPFRRRWRGGSYFRLDRTFKVVEPYDRVRAFLAAVTDCTAPHRIDAPARCNDELVALGFEPVITISRRRAPWALRTRPSRVGHDDVAALGTAGVRHAYRFRITDSAGVLPFQRPGWYAHGRGLDSELAVDFDGGDVSLDLSLPFERFDDAGFVAFRAAAAVLLGDPAHREGYTLLVPGPYGDGMAVA
jgi:uncharacterized protein (TIGR02996 family)